MPDQISVEKRQVALYDMSIEDVEIRKRERLEFESATKASNFLGIRPATVTERIKLKQYVYHRETKKKYAPRVIV